jgi:beta-lactamase class A
MRGLVATMMALAFVQPCGGQDAFEGKAEVKAALRGLFPYVASTTPPGLASHFAPSFLSVAPEADIAKTLRDLHQQLGQPRFLQIRRMSGPFAVEAEMIFKAERVPVLVTVESQPPHRIAAMVIQKAETDKDSWEDLAAEVKMISGKVACTVRLLDEQQKPYLEYNADVPLAVGSSFKLLLLATLAEEVALKRMTWQDVLRTDKRWYSLPGGILQDWPENSPVTLHSLATLMISRSDNTAADHLLHHLGQTRVATMQRRFLPDARFAVRGPHWNHPYLSTAELFKIKMKLSPEQQQAFAAAPSADRKKMLTTLVQPLSLDQPRMLAKPVHIDRIEWFYSTNDLCRIMNWLRREDRVPHLKEFLAIAQPFEIDETFWQYAGYKGGSEPGVLNFTLLLQNRKGTWYAVSITWNHSEEAKDGGRLREMVERILRLLQKQEM